MWPTVQFRARVHVETITIQRKCSCWPRAWMKVSPQACANRGPSHLPPSPSHVCHDALQCIDAQGTSGVAARGCSSELGLEHGQDRRRFWGGPPSDHYAPPSTWSSPLTSPSERMLRAMQLRMVNPREMPSMQYLPRKGIEACNSTRWSVN